jgi:hypothetical protein
MLVLILCSDYKKQDGRLLSVIRGGEEKNSKK